MSLLVIEDKLSEFSQDCHENHCTKIPSQLLNLSLPSVPKISLMSLGEQSQTQSRIFPTILRLF